MRDMNIKKYIIYCYAVMHIITIYDIRKKNPLGSTKTKKTAGANYTQVSDP
jgi:hypothetical protein